MPLGLSPRRVAKYSGGGHGVWDECSKLHSAAWQLYEYDMVAIEPAESALERSRLSESTLGSLGMQCRANWMVSLPPNLLKFSVHT